jgi:hypothetical protein
MMIAKAREEVLRAQLEELKIEVIVQSTILDLVAPFHFQKISYFFLLIDVPI